MIIKKYNQGFSLVEIILAIALFGLFATALIGLLMISYGSNYQAEEKSQAVLLAQEGLDAALSIRRQAWNLLVNGTYGLDNSSGYWQFSGSSELINDHFTRTVTIADACRDGSENIVDCGEVGAAIDINTKKITSLVTYTSINAVGNSVELISYATNWQSATWTQTDWAGGANQAIWSDPTAYDSDDGNVDVSTSGQVSLALLGSGGGCGDFDWPFTNAGDYTFNSSDIEVTGGAAQLAGVTTGYAIDDSIIDSFEFDSANGETPDIVNITGDIYAVAYQGPGDQGLMATFSIDSSGDITPTIIDLVNFDNLFAQDMDLLHISGDVYAIAYRSLNEEGWLVTYTIDSAGQISNSIVDELQFDSTDAFDPVIINVTGDVYAIAYEGPSDDGFLTTVTINSAGVIGDSVIETFEFNTSNGEKPDIIKISGNIFALVYDGPGSDGWAATISIDGSGNIGSIVDTLEFDSSTGTEPNIINISGDVYAVAYEGPGADGWLATFTIDSLGNIGNSIIDSLEFDVSSGGDPRILNITNEYYLIVYEGPGADGWAAIVSIEATGQIGNSIFDSFEFNTSNGQTPSVIGVANNIYAIAYEGASLDGFVTTLGVSVEGSYPTTQPSINPTDPHSVNDIAVWSSFAETATKGTGEIYYQISDGSDWYYWTGTDWNLASVCDGVTQNCNTVTEINAGIQSFPTTTAQISFRAFLDSDGTQQIQLDNVQISCAQNYDWPFTTDTDYNYDSEKIEVTSGVAQLVNSSGAPVSGSTTNPDFSSDAAGWTYADWSDSGNRVSGNYVASGGNPGGYINVAVNKQKNVTRSGYWQQAFTTTVDNPTIATTTLDWIVSQYNSSFVTSFQAYVFVESTSGAPTLGQQVWSSGEITGTTSWASVPAIDISSRLGTAGTYYLKVAVRVVTSGGGGAASGTNTVGFDNVALYWEGVSGGSYPADSPTINPISSLSVSGLNTWSIFTETATKGAGEIYYQLSDNDGGTWQYWDGAAWSNVAGATDYNTAAEVNTNIADFTTTTAKIMFKAFLASNGAQQIQLDNILVGWGEQSGSSGYATAGYLVSSAFNTTAVSSFNIISWDQAIPACTPACSVQLQVRTAPDASGSPGTWSDWYGNSGSGTYFTDNNETLLPAALNFNQWVQYRVELAGDGNDTPIFEGININYTP